MHSLHRVQAPSRNLHQRLLITLVNSGRQMSSLSLPIVLLVAIRLVFEKGRSGRTMNESLPRRRRPVFARTGEVHDLSAEQSEMIQALRTEIEALWPALVYDVGPAPVTTRDGVVVKPPEDQVIQVRYQNGPTLKAMKTVIKGRTRSCWCSSTVGAVLWIAEQPSASRHLRKAGFNVAEDVDLSAPTTVEQVALLDQWAVEVGLTSEVLQAEGFEISWAARRIATETGKHWPDISLDEIC